jgi:predicted DsbA family dithiol-disulfide isomerase
VYRNELRRRYEQFREIGMTGVPTVMINGQIVTSSSRTVECLTTLIDQAAGTAADSK